MTIAQVLFAKEALDALMYEKVDGQRVIRKMPFKLRYKIAKIEEALDKEFLVYEEERVKLVKEFGEEVTIEGSGIDTPPQYEVVDEEKKIKFFEALSEVHATEVDIQLPKLTEEDLEPIGDLDIDLTPLQLRAFLSLVVS